MHEGISEGPLSPPQTLSNTTLYLGMYKLESYLCH